MLILWRGLPIAWHMIEDIARFAQLSVPHLYLTCGAVVLAGLVRGFAGFGLSAILMACLAWLIAPKELIPVAFMLEAAASLAMLRGGMKRADYSVVWGLALCSALAVPIGMFATTTLPIETSKTIALLLVLGLAIAQLFRLTPAFLATRSGLYGTGFLAGIATGLAGVGGMVVALYVLASDRKPAQMRANLVMFLFIAMFTSAVTYFGYGLFTQVTLARAVLMIPLVLLGVGVGSALFRPALAPFYKRFCLFLLAGLALSGLARLMV